MSNQIQQIFTVSELNKKSKQWLEQGFHNIYVKGEVSNLARPASRHLYFTLKDDSAQIKCAYFRNMQNGWSQNLTNGQLVILIGNVTLYEARGDYQLVVTDIIPDGEGLLLQQIELLKQKLKSEGLFDPASKQSLPARPKTIAVITSASGAAIHDILTTLKNRFPIAKVFLYCCEVQGALAAETIIRALRQAICDKTNDVIIIARGGGSVEDLMPFNDESLAREIFHCPVPIVSGVGHETDFTICDFVADVRAATPTAAAQACSPDQTSLIKDISNNIQRMSYAIKQTILSHQQKYEWLVKLLLSPNNLMFSQRWQEMDYLQIRMTKSLQRIFMNKQNLVNSQLQKLQHQHPKQVIQTYQHQFSFVIHRLQQTISATLTAKQQYLDNRMGTLHALSPLATLNRGYAIASYHGSVITDPLYVNEGDIIDVQVKHGTLTCQVKKRKKIDD